MIRLDNDLNRLEQTSKDFIKAQNRLKVKPPRKEEKRKVKFKDSLRELKTEPTFGHTTMYTIPPCLSVHKKQDHEVHQNGSLDCSG